MLQMRVGDAVAYLIGKRTAAVGKITFVGGNGCQTRCGNVTVGESAVLFQIEKIKMKCAKPPIKCTMFSKNATIEDVLNTLNPPMIILSTSSLEKRVELNNVHVDASSQMPLHDYEPDIDLEAIVDDSLEESLAFNAGTSAVATSSVAASSLQLPTHNDVQFQQDCEYDSDDDIDNPAWSRSRIKEDVFHRFQDIPVKKGAPPKPAIANLLINCTFKKCKEDYKALTEILRRKSITNYDEHFYYNKEYWRERVRMFCPKGSAHAREVALIEIFVRDNQSTKECYTDELKLWFQ